MNDDLSINSLIIGVVSSEKSVYFLPKQGTALHGQYLPHSSSGFPPFLQSVRKGFLFDFVLSKQAVKAFLRNSAYGKGFIELLMIVSSSLWRLRSLFSFRLASLAASTCLTCEAARIFSVNFPDLLWQAG